jgi:hypothetical protein
MVAWKPPRSFVELNGGSASAAEQLRALEVLAAPE